MANKPKMDFMLNVPATVTLGDNFKNGNGQYGPWFGWGVVDQGIEKTLFADSDLQSKIAPFGKGAQVSITKSQIPGSKQFAWYVQPAGAPQQAAPPSYAAPAPAPQRTYIPDAPATNGNDRESYRTERIARTKDAVGDAMEALGVDVLDENVRALAISYLIDEQRKGIAAPEEVPF